jgi:putative endonuclease
MYTVYVLFSPSSSKIYVGYTSNLTERLKSHNQLAKKGYTIRFRPWVVAFSEPYYTKTEALKRERFLKSGIGRKLIQQKLRHIGLISA